MLPVLLAACAAVDSVATGAPAPITVTDTDTDTDTGTAIEPEVDVLIVGAGPAGLAAAIEAHRTGVSVRVLEREAVWGGSAAWVGGLLLFSGTSGQATLGVVDSPAQLLSEWFDITGGDASDPWVRYFAENNVAMVHNWLAEMGHVVDAPSNPDPSAGTTPRIHVSPLDGPPMVDTLGEQLPIDVFHFGAEALDLEQDADGRVIGVTWRDVDTEVRTTTYARAVIVATGGFMHDLDRVRAERPDLATLDLRHGSWTGADGNGLAMLEGRGAATQNLDAIGIYAHGAPAPGADPEEMFVDLQRGVPWVNNEGARFADETEVNSFPVGSLRAAQPDGDVWMVFDGAVAPTAHFTHTVTEQAYTLEELTDAGLLVSGATLHDLADALGVPAGTLETEIASFNAFSRDEVDDPFRDHPGSARSVVQAPFYALPVAVTIAKGFGGVDTDLSGRVLDTDGAPIPGLYAAGELTGMAGGSLVGQYGFTGSLSAVMLGGRVAGANAAAAVD